VKALLRHLLVVGSALLLALSSSFVLTAVVSGAYLLWSGVPLPELAPEIAAFLSGASPRALAIGVLCTSSPLLVLALLLGTTLGPLRSAMGLVRPALVDVLLVTVGMVAVSTAAGALVSTLGLVDDGALAQLTAAFIAMPMAVRVLMLPFTALAPGVAEELFFRGWALGRGLKYLPRTPALVISALAFGVMHVDPGHALAASIMGLYLGVITLRTGSVSLTIVAHVVNNTIATLAPELNSSSTDSLAEAALGQALGVGVAALMLWRLFVRHPPRLEAASASASSEPRSSEPRSSEPGASASAVLDGPAPAEHPEPPVAASSSEP